jgi:hypothetical protein
MNPEAVNHREVLERLRQLCQTQLAASEALDEAIQFLNRVGYQDEVITVLRESFSSPTPHPDAGAFWVRNKTTNHQWGLGEVLKSLVERGEVGRRAVIAYVRILGEAGRSKGLQALLEDHADWLRGHPAGWNAVAGALGKCGLHWRALRWTRDWKQREDADQSALYARACALRRWGITSKGANHMAALALDRPKNDEIVYNQLLFWTASESAFSGRTEQGARALNQVEAHKLGSRDVRLYRVMRSVLELQAMPVGERSEILDHAIRRIAKAFHGVPVWRQDFETHCLLVRAFIRLSLDSRNPKPLLWGAWRFYGRVVATIAACVIGIIILPFLGLLILYMPCCFLFIGIIAYLAVAQRRGGR